MAFMPGATHVLQCLPQWALPPREGERIPKSRHGSDRRLQLACVKMESLVIAHQHGAVNTFSGLVHTARHAMEAGGT